jgi:group I intron endonuclease
MTTCGIYKILNKISGDFYIGSTTKFERRFRQHRHLLRANKHSNIYLQRAWNKYREESFDFIILEYCEEDNLVIREQFYFDTETPKYNMNKNAESNRGLKWSEESKKRQSERMKGKPNIYAAKKRGTPWNKGLKKSPEECKRMSEARKGKPNSSSTKFKKGEIRYPERLVAVKCIELGIIFNSLAEAGRFVGNANKYSNILACCHGKQKNAYGYTWELVKEQKND